MNNYEYIEDSKYVALDKVLDDFTSEEFASYIFHNYREYAVDLAYRIEMEIIIEDREKKDARED